MITTLYCSFRVRTDGYDHNICDTPYLWYSSNFQNLINGRNLMKPYLIPFLTWALISNPECCEFSLPVSFSRRISCWTDDMKVTVQYYDGKPMSASVPQRVTCTVVDAQPNTKGLTAAPQ